MEKDNKKSEKIAKLNEIDKDKATKYLNSIFGNCSNGLQSIHDILPNVENEKLKQELKEEYTYYQVVYRKCEDFAKKYDLQIKDNNWFKKARMYTSIKMTTITNKKTRKLAEMLILGTVMGLNECYKNKWDFNGVSEELDCLLDELQNLQENYYKNLKSFLKKNI